MRSEKELQYPLAGQEDSLASLINCGQTCVAPHYICAMKASGMNWFFFYYKADKKAVLQPAYGKIKIMENCK